MFKLRTAICLALFVGTLTLAVGLITEARLTTIIYRTIISFLLFGVLGFLFGSLAERFLHEFLQKLTNKGQGLDVVSEKMTDQLEEQNGFSPFDPDNFEHIAQKKE